MERSLVMQTEEDYKKAFASEYFKNPSDPFKIACVLFPDNTNLALRVANEWPSDSFVLACLDALSDNDMPTEVDLCRKVWNKMEFTSDAKDFATLAKLYAEIRGFIKKQESAQVNVQVNNKVMVVKDHGTDEQWESKLIRQQTALANGTYSVN